ncbi:MAG TPA: adenylate/guanylate cyclase domain-containing protein [Acidimicrobiia bacterium]|jgi:class 3 adenylate cyclase
MTNTVGRSSLEAGRAAYDAHDWEVAWRDLHDADADSPLEAEDLERLADSTRWSGRYDELIPVLERAQAAFEARGDARGAARLALALARDHYDQNRTAVARGWWMRAFRALERVPESREHGLLQWMYAHTCFESGDFDEALRASREVAETARRLHDRDLEALALHDQGHALIACGEVERGLALVDEAMTVAMGDAVGLMTAGTVYCGTIWACRNVGDWRRASEWTDASIRWCERVSVTRFPGLCRFHRAEVMRVRGSLDAAERDAAEAAADLLVSSPRNAGWALGELGEVRRRRGDVAGAAEAFGRAVEVGFDPQPGAALLRLDQGDAPGALRALRRALTDPGGLTAEARWSVLPAGVRIAIEADDVDAARAFHAELAHAAELCGTPMFRAAEVAARGRLELATGQADAAVTTLRTAVRLLCELEAPYEASELRVALATAYRATGDSDDADLELRAARAGFERLGAVADAARIDASTRPADVTTHAFRTFLFTDIVDSTRLVEVLGDDAWGDVLSWHDRTFRTTFRTYGGDEIAHVGDGFFVAFERTSSALDCAIALQRVLLRHRHENGFAPSVRMGVHAGDALDRGGNYGGREVHVAARVAGLAAADEILVTVSTTEQDATRTVSEPRSVALKGVAEPVDVVRLDWR